MNTTSLHHKSNEHLISDLKTLVAKEREVLLELLHYLREVERRRLYLRMGFSSLFSLMTESLGFSEGAAQRRIQAMRLLKSVPEAAPKLKSGEISLTVASQVQGFIGRENKRRKQDKAPLLQATEKLNLLHQLEGTSSRECERQLARIAPESSLPPEKTRVITESRTMVQFVAHEALMAKLEKLKCLTSHSNPEGKYDLLFDRLADLALDRLDPERRAKRREQRKKRNPGSEPRPKGKAMDPQGLPPAPAVKRDRVPATRSRYISQSLKDRIYLRDQARCQYLNPRTKKPCGSTYQIQFEHKYPFSLGGEPSEQNLRLYCKKHNLSRTEGI